jgi:hypothetical protein
MLTSQQVSAANAAGRLKVDGFDFSLSPDEVGHVRAEHGNDAVERRQGQRAVTPMILPCCPSCSIKGATLCWPVGQP